jgi:hypothetical protein
MGGAFAGSDWAVFQGASEAAIPLGLARASNAEKRPKRFQPLRVALKRGRGPRWILSCSPQWGCAFESALPAASFECNKCLFHLISGSLVLIDTAPPFLAQNHKTAILMRRNPVEFILWQSVGTD